VKCVCYPHPLRNHLHIRSISAPIISSPLQASWWRRNRTAGAAVQFFAARRAVTNRAATEAARGISCRFSRYSRISFFWLPDLRCRYGYSFQFSHANVFPWRAILGFEEVKQPSKQVGVCLLSVVAVFGWRGNSRNKNLLWHFRCSKLFVADSESRKW